MKIVHIITGLSTGGAERALYNLLHGGLKDKFDSHVISLSDLGTIGPQIKALGVSVTTLDMPAGRPTLSGVLKLHAAIKEIGPDLIQGWMYHGNLAATLARAMFASNAVLVWNIRQSLYQINNEKRMTRLVIRANGLLSNSSDALLYNSQLSRQQHEALGYADIKGKVIPNGIDIQRFSFSDNARLNLRNELAIPADALVVGHVARLHPMKDHRMFLQAAVDIAQSNTNVHFVLSGRNVSLDNPDLEKIIPDELLERFHLLGERADVAQLMSTMDILVLSSAWGEGFPNVLGEAMAVGVPCIATDVGDSALVIGDCGTVVSPGDKAALISALVAMLALPTRERRQLGEQARRRIEEHFTLAAIVDKYASLYRSIILQKRKA